MGMAKIAIGTGILLVVLGLAFYIGTGSAHMTALIPAWFGLAIGICGQLGHTEDTKTRALWMHIAVVFGLVGFLFPGFRALRASLHASTLTDVQRVAMQESWAMAAICLVFTALCVRNFIANRRTRLAATESV